MGQNKTAMLDNLLEIEVAYSLLKQEEGEETMDPIDYHYKQLKTHIEVGASRGRSSILCAVH